MRQTLAFSCSSEEMHSLVTSAPTRIGFLNGPLPVKKNEPLDPVDAGFVPCESNNASRGSTRGPANKRAFGFRMT